MKPISTQKAHALRFGLKRYESYEPCKNGHMSERYTSNDRCVECAKVPPAEKKNAKRAEMLAKRQASYDAFKTQPPDVSAAQEARRAKRAEILAKRQALYDSFKTPAKSDK